MMVEASIRKNMGLAREPTPELRSYSTVQLEKFGDKCQNTPKVTLFSIPQQPHLT